MAIFTDTRGGQQYKILFTSSEGREYWVTMTAVGMMHDKPPMTAQELENGFVHTTEFDMTYVDMHELAIEHGCILGDMVSVDTVH